MRIRVLGIIFVAVTTCFMPAHAIAQIELIATHEARHNAAYTVGWTHSGELISGGIDGKVVIGNRPETQLSQSIDILSPLTLASFENSFLVAGFNDRPQVLQRVISPTILPGTRQSSIGLVIDPTRNRIATAGDDRFHVWRWTSSGYEIVDSGKIENKATSLTWLPSDVLAIGDNMGTIQLRDTNNQSWNRPITTPTNAEIKALERLPGGQKGVISGHADGKLFAWTLSNEVVQVSNEEITHLGFSQKASAIIWRQGVNVAWSHLEEFAPDT